MGTSESSIFAAGLMAAVTFPVAFGIARLCLAGLLHLIRREPRA